MLTEVSAALSETWILPSRTQWRVEIRLPKDKAYFETRAMWNNPTPLPQTYYNWMTAAAVVTDDLEFFISREQGTWTWWRSRSMAG